ncbi:MAG: chitobiase/beta-hexosaminidase C-terminal domain-containing protein, partial [Spirochaetia bacterium]|nr:chitobiase/beta-hexosaminidase C-terminal domain-containing protein [Spirochaetia bacterium]
MRRFYLFLTVVLFLFFSCANNIADNKNDLAAMLILQNLQKKETSNTTVKYGSITINTGNSESRATDVASISTATVTVYWGNKAEEKKDASVDFSGNGKGSVTINEIPVGKNRVVVVEAAENFNNIINKMAGIEISAVTDVEAGNNNVTVNWKSTAEGNVYRRLLSSSKVNFENISRDDVQALINENVHSSLIDSDLIAADIINNSKKSADSYVKTAGSVKFTSGSSENNVIFQVCDPASAKLDFISSGVNIISGVTPGTWKVLGLLNDSVIFSKSVDVASGAEVDLGTIQFKTPVPRLEDSTGKQISEFISGSTKVYLKARTYDDETPLSDVVIYYTTDGTEPDASSTKYTSAGISVDVGTTLKAVAISSLLGNSNVSSWTFEKPSIGMQHPKTGNYSVASTDTTAVLGANVKGDKTSFVLYSANATKVLLEIYSKPFGDAVPLYDYWMEKDSNNYWRITLNGNLKNAIYAFRCWGPNWEYSDSWTRGGSAAGFVADYDSKGNRFNPNKVVFDPYAKEITHDPSNKDALSHSPSTEKPYNALSTGADFRNYDSGKIAPKGYIISDSTSYGTKPGIPQKDAIIYEAHVRGITKHSSTANLSSLLSGYSQFDAVQDIPSEYRGTYKGASYLVPYLKALGINTIE